MCRTEFIPLPPLPNGNARNGINSVLHSAWPNKCFRGNRSAGTAGGRVSRSPEDDKLYSDVNPSFTYGSSMPMQSIVLTIALSFCLFASPLLARQDPATPKTSSQAIIKPEVEGALKNVALYATRMKPLTVEEIKSFVGDGVDVKVITQEKGQWTSLEIKYGKKATLTLLHEYANTASMQEHLQNFSNYVFVQLAEEKMTQYVFHTIRQIKQTNHFYSLIGEPALPGESIAFVQKMASDSRAIVFTNHDVLDPSLRVLVGDKGRRDETAKLPSFESAAKRKARSTKVLAAKKLTPLAQLPTITAEEELDLRDAKNVARRIICLTAIAIHGDSPPDFDAIEFLKKHKVWDFVSPEEKTFLEAKDLPAKEKEVMTWRYEAAWALLWSLGKVEEIGFPDKICDSKIVLKNVLENADELIKTAKLRDASEILDQTDLLYRCYWLVRHSTRTEKPLKEISGSVVYERLYALNWLTRYMRKKWDETVVDS